MSHGVSILVSYQNTKLDSGTSIYIYSAIMNNWRFFYCTLLSCRSVIVISPSESQVQLMNLGRSLRHPYIISKCNSDSFIHISSSLIMECLLLYPNETQSVM